MTQVEPARVPAGVAAAEAGHEARPGDPLTAVHNPYLEGPFAPITEEITAVDLRVTGTIPPELNGRLVRVGPNPIGPQDPEKYNWFTGSGMAHGVRLREGRAEWYRNRYVRDQLVEAELGLPPTPGPQHLGRGPKYVASNVVNTHVFAQAGRTWAFAEAGVLPVELSYELETLRRCDFGGTLNGSWTGHPHRDPATGDLHAVTYFWDWDHVTYQVLGTDGRIRQAVDIPLPGRPVVHDIALSERFAVFLDGPVMYHPGLHAQGYDFPYMWDRGYATRFGLIPRDARSAADVIWCEVEQTAMFHILGAYDLPDGRVVVDGCAYSKMFVDQRSGPGEDPGRLDRFLLDPRTGRTTVERLDDRSMEMPRLDERRTGRRHRYGYFSSRDGGASALLKADLERGTSETYEYGPGRSGMEAVFEPCTPDAAEDDGWLMTYVSDMTTGTSEVVILHSQDLAAGPVATIHLPQRVPLGFHGNWIPDADVAAVPGA